MVTVRIGDLFESNAQTIVNTVNCVGVMGKGVALEFKRRFPEMFKDYEARCGQHQVQLGEPYLYRQLLEPWILNFPTKDHWRGVSNLAAIVEGLSYLERHYQQWGITSLAVPPLGCGQGQLEWKVVGPTLFRHLQRFDIPVVLFAPFGTKPAELDSTFLAEDVSPPNADVGAPAVSGDSRIPAAWLAIAAVVGKIERAQYHGPIGHVTFQKIAYFATVAGIPTGLTYGRNSYGPFSNGIKPMLASLQNNGVLVEERQGDWFQVRTGPAFGDAMRSHRAEIENWAVALRKVTDLFLRMPDPEIGATVVYVARELNEDTTTESQVLAEVLAWKKRRRPPLSVSAVAAGVRNMNMLGWVQLTASDDLPVPLELYG